MRFVGLRSLILMLLIGLAGCSAPARPAGKTPDVSSEANAMTPPKHWDVFLVAGDNAAPVFDHAVDRLAGLLTGPAIATVHRFSADDSKVAVPDVATVDNLTAAMAATMASQAVTEDAGCFVFVTSHGSHDGVVLKADFAYQQTLSPVRLGDILDTSCGKRPTVAIISACFSGIFLDMAAPNRIILTAARADRTSFGCGAGFTYTYYDECLLNHWSVAQNFRRLYDMTLDCLHEKERQMNVQLSQPQAAFGQQVADLPLPR